MQYKHFPLVLETNRSYNEKWTVSELFDGLAEDPTGSGWCVADRESGRCVLDYQSLIEEPQEIWSTTALPFHLELGGFTVTVQHESSVLRIHASLTCLFYHLINNMSASLFTCKVLWSCTHSSDSVPPPQASTSMLCVSLSLYLSETWSFSHSTQFPFKGFYSSIDSLRI